MTLAELTEAVRPMVSDAVFPDGFKAGWWVMGIQLDLRAKKLAAVEKTKPSRLHRA